MSATAHRLDLYVCADVHRNSLSVLRTKEEYSRNISSIFLHYPNISRVYSNAHVLSLVASQFDRKKQNRVAHIAMQFGECLEPHFKLK